MRADPEVLSFSPILSIYTLTRVIHFQRPATK